MDLPRTLEYLLNEVTRIPDDIGAEDYTDDSSNTILGCDDNVDSKYDDIMNALTLYINPILIEEIGGDRLSENWCLVPGYPDPMQLFYYNSVTSYLSSLMQTAKGHRPITPSMYTEENIDRVYSYLQQLNPSDSVIQLYNDCLNSLLSCIGAT